jgi:CPA2 family monovalent cation:H+ antiporter-2
VETAIVQNLFFVLVSALIGGLLLKLLKLPILIGYILAGIVGGMLLPIDIESVKGLAEVGIILLLFSIGLELSLNSLFKMGKIVFLGALLQTVITALVFLVTLNLLGIDLVSSGILALAFALSSTAVVIKILSERGETGTIHGQIMIGWTLIQDLAVIPIMAILPALGGGAGERPLVAVGKSLGLAFVVVAAIFLIGRIVVPKVIHKVTAVNSRELLLLVSVSLALGIALLVSLFGVSAALGAFLAGVVLSETQENHAIFAETRPLRDLFVVLFFVTLGFLIDPAFVIANLALILGLSALVLILKFLIIFAILVAFGYHGKTIIAPSLGLAQVGEFSFVLFLAAGNLGIISAEVTSVGFATTLVTLLATPFLFKSIVPLWRRTKKFKLVSGWNKSHFVKESILENHIIIAGFGRIGRWVGLALEEAGIQFVAIDYNQRVVREAQKAGVTIFYGDPAEPEVLEGAGIRKAKALVIAIPDRIAQEEVVSYTQTVAPKTKIIARATQEEDWRLFSDLKVEKIVQPEFEAAVYILKNIFGAMGKKKEDINEKIKKLRLSHAHT